MSGVELLRASLASTRADPAKDDRAFDWHGDGALLIRDGRIAAAGDFATVHRDAPDAPVTDWRGGVILPGLVDTHIHFPQLRIIGALGRTLLDWLEQAALPEEIRMADVAYATRTARQFVQTLVAHGTTTAMVFGAHFAAATAALFDAADAARLRIVSGLVVSDRALPVQLHQTVEHAYRDSTELIHRFHRSGRRLYAVTPRFAFSTSDAMLEMCQTLVQEHPTILVQSHINEHGSEMAGVRTAFPWASDYLAVYERYSLIGRRTVLAHNVHPTDGELARLAASRTTVAHCPASNAALGSGIFPFRRHVEAGVHVALGTDVGGGTGFSMLREALCAHLMQRVSPSPIVVGARQMLYLATLAGAEALSLDAEIGSLCAGKAADIVYLKPQDNSPLAAALERAAGADEVLGAMFTLADADSVREVRISGERVYPA